jgi:hypothetical protein
MPGLTAATTRLEADRIESAVVRRENKEARTGKTWETFAENRRRVGLFLTGKENPASRFYQKPPGAHTPATPDYSGGNTQLIC